MQGEDTIIRSSGENNIELIKEYRDELLSQLLNNDFLNDYLQKHFQIASLSEVKLEFIKRSLIELRSSSIDLSHYSALILATRKKGFFSISTTTEQFFQKDIERTIKNYL